MLALAACPSLDTNGLKNLLLNNVDPDVALAGKTVTGGRLNIGKAVRACAASGPSVSPSSGTGASQRFTFTFSGIANPASVNMVINSSLSGANGCYFIYEPPSNMFDMVDNNGSIGGRAAPGAGGTLSNSQCSIAPSSVSVTNSAGTMTVSATVNFTGSFNGPKSIWATWYTGGVQQGGWQTVGAYSVSATTVGGGSTAQNVTPASASGSSQQFVFTFPGVANPSSVNMLINGSFSGANGCYIIYEVPPNTIDMVDNVGSIGGRATPGSNATLTNSQCSLQASSVSVNNASGTITVAVTVNFTGSFAGAKTIWTTWYSGSVQQGSWQTVGSYTVTAAPPSGIAATPSSGTGSSQRFTFTFPSVSNVGSVNMLINSAFSGSNGCYFIWEVPPNTFDLVDNNGGIGGRVTPGGAGTLSNSQCSVQASSVSVSNSGGTITVSATVNFTQAFNGPKTIWATWYSGGQQQGTWQGVGTWTVQ